MNKKLKLYFMGYYIFFPLVFIISFFIWMYLVKQNHLWTVLSDGTSISGLYYMITSIVFVFYFKNKI